MTRRRADVAPGEDEQAVSGRRRLTPIGAVILGVLAAAVVALFVGSSGVQSVGAVAIVLILLVFVAAKSPTNRRL